MSEDAPAPIEEVEMSVLDALKEVRTHTAAATRIMQRCYITRTISHLENLIQLLR